MSLNFEFIVKDPRWDAEELSEIGARVACGCSFLKEPCRENRVFGNTARPSLA